jgi:uncharacterized integral membrane protein
MTENPDRQAAPGAAPVPAQVKHTRLGGLWLMLALGAVVLVLLLVFILMNGQRVQVHLYGAHLTAPLGVALLLAAALGVLLVVVPGGGRILQLKRAARKLHREREHLAGRLGEVTDATATPAPDAEAARQAGRQDGQAATAGPGQAAAGAAPGQAGAPGQAYGGGQQPPPPQQQPPTRR